MSEAFTDLLRERLLTDDESFKIKSSFSMFFISRALNPIKSKLFSPAFNRFNFNSTFVFRIKATCYYSALEYSEILYWDKFVITLPLLVNICKSDVISFTLFKTTVRIQGQIYSSVYSYAHISKYPLCINIRWTRFKVKHNTTSFPRTFTTFSTISSLSSFN